MAGPRAFMDIIDTTTVLSLLSTLAILGAAYILSVYSLPGSASTKVRILFIWHAFDALIHFILEGSYLYNCFYSFIDLSAPRKSLTSSAKDLAYGYNGTGTSEFLPPGIFFLGRRDRLYGAEYGSTPFSALWREYAKADARWRGSDLTVVSLELLTVFLMAPIAVWVCVCLTRKKGVGAGWFWMVVLATGELYGGFMTFAPEWLSGSPNLDTSNFMYLWIYLFFFNTLWVWIPLWILYEAFFAITGALSAQESSNTVKKTL